MSLVSTEASLAPKGEQIQVSLRFRPLSLKEKVEGSECIWSVSSSTVSLTAKAASALKESHPLTVASQYSYDHVFTSRDSNRTVYTAAAQRAVLASLEGYNGTIFLYGQTSSGKTYTMLGSPDVHEEKGVLLCALDDITERIESDAANTYSISCSYVEIFNEQVFDLLDDEPKAVPTVL
jgi:hypothetical protein